MKSLKNLKVAIVHDQLSEFGGAEKVLIVLKEIFPQADIFTTVYNSKKLSSFKDLISKWKVYVSWFGKIPIIKNYYSPFRFLTPLIWESFDFSKYDLVISSSGSWMSKGIKTKKPTLHISYIHHPPRYLYGYETAIEWQKYWIIKIYAYIVNHFLRMWDFQSSQRPDFLIANSIETQKRIEKFYRRKSTVIYPPVDIPTFTIINEVKNFSSMQEDSSELKDSSIVLLPQNDKKLKLKDHSFTSLSHNDKITQNNRKNEYYITVSRLARAKHVDILIKAANTLGFNLKIIGTGRDEKYLKSLAGKTVEFLGSVNDALKNQLYKNAKAFLFASVDEEFGIAPVEAMGYGLPVIAYNSGGIPEYLKNNFNGFLYNQLSSESLIEKIKIFEKLKKEQLIQMKKNSRKTAEKFSKEKFKEKMLRFINKVKQLNRKSAIVNQRSVIS